MDVSPFVSSFNFIGSQIIDFVFHSDFLDAEVPDNVSRSIDLKRNVLDCSCQDDSWLGVEEITLSVNIKSKNDDDAKCIVLLTMQGGFFADKNMPEDEFKKMLEINGSAALYSIARGFIQSVSAQSFVKGQIDLPLLNFFDIPQSNESESIPDNAST